MRRWLLLLVCACDPSKAPIDYELVDEACRHTGGAVETRTCCEGVLDFPATCGGDPCTCTREESWGILGCECGVGTCFDGRACVRLPET